jgi:hypothetical protein
MIPAPDDADVVYPICDYVDERPIVIFRFTYLPRGTFKYTNKSIATHGLYPDILKARGIIPSSARRRRASTSPARENDGEGEIADAARQEDHEMDVDEADEEEDIKVEDGELGESDQNSVTSNSRERTRAKAKILRVCVILL